MADVARLAGVSKATVSRALNDSPLVNAATRERVREVASAHRFQINATARSLSRRHSNVVALATYAHGAAVAGEKLPDAFVLELTSGLISALHEHGYDLLLIQIDNRDTSWVDRYLDSQRADGFILLGAGCTARHLRALERRGAAFVVWGLDSASRSFSSVTGDSFAGGRLATRHLLQGGRRQIAFIGGPDGEQEVRDRYRGYAAALTAAGIKVDGALVSYGSYSSESAATRTRELLERRRDLDAVFACSDVMAIAAIDVLRMAARRVPEDVAVVGYDDISLAAHTDPPLTTVRQSGPLAGRLLAEGLLAQLRTGAAGHVAMPAELVVRQSA
jgi:DNA-binding LacI/PurR family transcriptional regulator